MRLNRNNCDPKLFSNVWRKKKREKKRKIYDTPYSNRFRKIDEQKSITRSRLTRLPINIKQSIENKSSRVEFLIATGKEVWHYTSLKRRRSLDNDGMFHLVPFYSLVIPSSLTQQSSCRRGTDHLGIISFMALPYGPPLASRYCLKLVPRCVRIYPLYILPF